MSHNYVCGASSQVITEGSACRLVVLIQAAGYSPLAVVNGEGASLDVSQVSMTDTASTSYWRPVSLFMEATYGEEDGQFYLAETEATVWSLLGLLRSLQYPQATPRGDGRSDYPFDLKSFLAAHCPAFSLALERRSTPLDISSLKREIEVLWRYFNDALPRNRAFVWCHISRQVRQLGMFVVHEKAFEGLVDFTKGVVDYGQFSFEPSALVQRARAHAAEAIKKQKIVLPISDSSYGALAEFFHGAVAGFFAEQAIFDGITYAARLDSLQLCTVRELVSEVPVRSILRDDVSDDERLALVWPWLQSVYAIVAMDRMNLTFAPQRSSVSDYGVAPGQAFASFVSKVSAAVVEADEEKAWGPFQAYTALFSNHAEALRLQSMAPALDVVVRDLVVLRAAGIDQMLISFRMTAQLDEVRSLLERHEFGSAAETLQMIT